MQENLDNLNNQATSESSKETELCGADNDTNTENNNYIATTESASQGYVPIDSVIAKTKKKPLTKKDKIRFVIDVLVVLGGAALMAFGAIAFFMPHYVVPGGFTGFAMVLHRIYTYDNPAMLWLGPGIVAIILNIPLFIIALRSRGKSFLLVSIIGTIAFSLFIELFILLRLDYHLSALTGNPLLAIVYGAVIAGIGFGMIIRRGGSTGGSDLFCSLLNKKFPKLSYGTLLFMFDGMVVLFSGIVNSVLIGFPEGLEPALYAILGIFITSFVADYIIVGKNRAISFFIICKDPKTMSAAIYAQVGRGITALRAKGMYSDTEKEVLLCVVKRRQAIKLKRVVLETEEGAFIFSHNVGEVFGEGFITSDSNTNNP